MLRGPGRRERRFEVLAVGRCPALAFGSFRCPLAGKRRRDAGKGVPACELVSVGGRRVRLGPGPGGGGSCGALKKPSRGLPARAVTAAVRVTELAAPQVAPAAVGAVPEGGLAPSGFAG